jgi:hypothetical protein
MVMLRKVDRMTVLRWRGKVEVKHILESCLTRPPYSEHPCMVGTVSELCVANTYRDRRSETCLAAVEAFFPNGFRPT